MNVNIIHTDIAKNKVKALREMTGEDKYQEMVAFFKKHPIAYRNPAIECKTLTSEGINHGVKAQVLTTMMSEAAIESRKY